MGRDEVIEWFRERRIADARSAEETWKAKNPGAPSRRDMIGGRFGVEDDRETRKARQGERRERSEARARRGDDAGPASRFNSADAPRRSTQGGAPRRGGSRP